jgi:SAM-dependent methyltransferase
MNTPGSSVDDYLDRLGFVSVEDFDALRDYLTEKCGSEYFSEIEAIMEGQAESDYDVYFRTPETTLATTIAFEGDWIRTWLEWLSTQDLPAGDVLDVGSGSGIPTLYLAMQRPNDRVIGVDSSGGAVGSAKELAERLGVSNVEFRQLDAASIDELGQRFSLVVSSAVVVDASALKGPPPGFSDITDFDAALAQSSSFIAKSIAGSLREDGRYLSFEKLSHWHSYASWVGALAHAGLGVDLGSSELVHAHDGGSFPAFQAGPGLPVPRRNDLIAWLAAQPAARDALPSLADELRFRANAPWTFVAGWQADIQDREGEGRTRWIIATNVEGTRAAIMVTDRGYRRVLAATDDATEEFTRAVFDEHVQRVQYASDVVGFRELVPEETADLLSPASDIEALFQLVEPDTS